MLQQKSQSMIDASAMQSNMNINNNSHYSHDIIKQGKNIIIYNPGRGDRSHFSNYYLVISTTLIYFFCGITSAVDAYCGLYYINNPNIYAFNLAYEYGFWLTPYYSLQYDPSFINSALYLNIKDFKTMLKENTTMTEEHIYNYILVHKELSGDISRRYFVYLFLFSFGLVISSICGYSLRRPTLRWKIDIGLCFLHESLSSLGFLGGITIWFFIEFMGDYKYFVYLTMQSVFHYMSIILYCIGLGIKIYWMIVLYTFDYFDTIKTLNNHKELEDNK